MRNISFVLLALLLAGSNVAHAQVRLVARTGDASPGVAGTFLGFDAPAINAAGQVAFGGTSDDGEFNFTDGLWSEGDGIGALRAVALEGTPAPTAGGLNFTGFYDPERSYLFNDLGDVAFLGELSGFIHAIYTDRERGVGPALLEIARNGQPAVDTGAGRTYNGLDLLAMGRIHSGTAFKAHLAPGDAPNNFPSEGVYNEGFAVVLGNVAEVADTAPGTVRPSVGGGLALFTEFRAPTINDSGHVAFSATTNAGSSVGSIGGEGIWATSPGETLRGVALAGQPAPGTSTTFSIIFGRSFEYDSTAVINDDGDIAFTATLNGLISGGLRVGAWVERDGVVQKVAYESEAAPETASTFNRINEPLIDAEGLAVFGATLVSGGDGVWRETAPGVLDMLALEGAPAPGTALNYLNILDLAINRPGRVAFRAQLSDIGSTALFSTDDAGVVHKIAAKGDVVDVEGSSMRVDELFFQGITGSVSGPAGGVGSGLSDSGQLAAVLRGEILDEELEPTGEFLDALVVIDGPIGCAPGDFDCDGNVDGDDFLVWQRNHNVGDLADWRMHFGMGGGVQAVPEPGSSALVLLAITTAAMRRGRGHRATSR
jgi:hypothetical protein